MLPRMLARRFVSSTLLALFVAACSGSADPPQPPTTAPPPPPPPAAQAPLVTSNPASQTVDVGQTATFTVVATGTGPLAYQWRRGGQDIAGATSATYTTPPAQATDDGASFDVRVSNAQGTVTSASATLTVRAAAPVLTLTQQPANATVAAGAAATFTVGATCTGGALTYQWQRMSAGGQFADVPGATGASHTTPPTQASDNAAQYRARVSCGSQTQTSNAAILTVTTPPGPAGVVLSVLPVGLGPAARPEQTKGVVRESAGSYLFVDDVGLRRLSADLGSVTTLVRSTITIADAVDGPAATARLANARGVAVDGAGNVYVTDGTNTVRRLGTDGNVTTLAGSPGNPGTADGSGAAARFNGPDGIVFAPDGALYVADRGNARIRRVTLSGVVSTWAGSSPGYADGAPAVAQFNNPVGLAVAANGDLYVTDQSNHRVRRIPRSGSVAGDVETLAGNGTQTFADGTGTAAGIAAPSRIALAGGVLFVGDFQGRVRRIELASRAVTTLAGAPIPFPRTGVNDGTGAAATFDNTFGGYAAMPDGRLLVSDRRQFRTVTDAGVVRTVGPLSSVGANAANPPDGVLTDQMAFSFSGTAGTAVVGDGGGTAYVGDAYRWIRRVTGAGAVAAHAGLPGGECCLDGVGTEVQFGRIFSLARDATGTLFVGDRFAVRRVQPDGATSLVAGAYDQLGAVDALGPAARFNAPNGIAVAASGEIFVADANAAIRRIDTTGNVTTFAGVMGQPGFADGAPATARFSSTLRQMTLAPDGSLYVCDGNRLRRVSTDGTTSTIASADGCTAPVFDTDGTLYWVQGGGSAGLYRLAAGGSPERLVTVTGLLNDLASSPQTLGTVLGMGLLEPKKLVLVAGGELLQAALP